jgi:oligo-1,6-glucosidase
MVFTFEHVSLDQAPGGAKWDLLHLDLPVLKKNLAAWQEGLAEVGWNSLYWNNHDQPRAVSRFGDDSAEHRANSAKTLGTVLHLHRGTPYVYQGEELGMTNTYYSEIAHYADLESINYHAEALSLGLEAESVMAAIKIKSRDNARSPMQWDNTSHAGFTEGVPWLAANANYLTVNAAEETADPDSVFHHYRRLIGLRHDHQVVVDGRFELLLADHDQLWVFTRTLDDQRVLVLANCSSTPAELPLDDLPSFAGAEVWLATHPDSAGAVLAPWESRVLLLR